MKLNHGPALAAILLGIATGLRADVVEINVNPHQIVAPVSPYMTGSCLEDVNHEIYGGIYSQMIFGESFQEPEGTAGSGLSKWWKPVQRETAQGRYELIHDRPLVGSQSQRVSFLSGAGEIGVANAGLNGQGISFVAGEPYGGEIWVRAAKPVDLRMAAASEDGSRIYGTTTVRAPAGDWERLAFILSPHATDPRGRVEIALTAPGSVDLGYVFLQPGSWGRFHGLPVRGDVANLLVNQGVTVMRYGGSMVNAPEYRWKSMTGPRAKRTPYHGTWYPYSSNGWGIPDFCALCDAAGFLGIPAFNMGETPPDMADFLEYAHGGAGTKWGAQRIADGYAAPFKVHVIELGNEERVNDAYWQKFEPIARTIWSRDPKMILTVADFGYNQVITDPFHVTGGSVDSLAAHQKILALAKEYGAEVWFDVHLGTGEVPPPNAIDPLLSYIHALKGLGNGAKFHVVTYELNADRHDLTRALANARMIGLIERTGAEPVVTSANALQVDRQNDNRWNQGLLFMTPDKVWLQPPGYVTQMMSRNRLANVVQGGSATPGFDVTATASADGKAIVLQVVNAGGDVPARIRLGDFSPARATVTELAGPLNAVNSADAVQTIVPKQRTWTPAWQNGAAHYTFPAHSFTVMRLE